MMAQLDQLTHWGRVTHICVSKLTIIGSDNGLSPDRRQAIIWTNYGILLIGPLGTNFSEISIGIQTFSFKKIYLKMSSGKWRPSCLGLNVLMEYDFDNRVETSSNQLTTNILKFQRWRLRRPISEIRMILLMGAKTWMTSLIIMFAVRPICVQDSIFKMSSESPGLNLQLLKWVDEFPTKL